MDRLKQKLQEAKVGQILQNEPLANHTTWKIGGPAQLFVNPVDLDGLIKTLILTHEANIPLFVIGRGSNLLIGDKGIKGVVVKLSDGLSHLDINGEEVRVGGGYSLIKLATVISKKGLSGLEFAGGIPGSVGGAVYMNAGAHRSDISKILKRARVLYPNGEMKWYEKEEMDFSYRTSRLQREEGICVEAIFQLIEGDREAIVSEMQKNKESRRQTQPWNYPSCGSVFRNPLPHYAGQLIEEAGLKGYRIGGAQVSEVHSNFIVNKGDATASDVLGLISYIKETVYQKFGVKMEAEVKLVES